MLKHKFNQRFWILAVMSVVLSFALIGCAVSGEVEPGASEQADVPSIESREPDTSEEMQLGDHGTVETEQPGTDPISKESPECSEVPNKEQDTVPEPSAQDVPEPAPGTPSVPAELIADTTAVDAELAEEAVALSSAPVAVPQTVSATAPGMLEKRSSDAVVDYSNTTDGYVMVQYLVPSDVRLKVQVKGPATTYTYNLTPQSWTVFPLSDGNGSYQISIYKNVTGTKYAAVLSVSTDVTLKNEFAPFLHSNQYVDYDHAPNTVTKAAELIGAVEDPLRQVEIVYDYVVKGMTYDKELAATVKSGYLPVLDSVLEKKTGICFDYAALMTGMLRSQDVPCKLVVGYAGSAYHAWISVWVEGSGWVDGVIWFDGSSWQRMDPTFASSGNSSESILSYIGDGTNYTAKYFY